jgi:hypothetical protein
MLFLLQHHNAIEAVYRNEDTTWVETLMADEAYQTLFGNMGFDEAYDRYETMLAEGKP